MEITAEQQNELISKLLPQMEKRFSAPVSRIETHISTILLVADKAFKIKKPVNFGFLDFSTLDKRHFYCQEELRLNSRLAPVLYEKVLTVTGTIDDPQIDGTADVVEYMIQMQRFEQHNELDHLLDAGSLKQEHIDELATVIANFHRVIPAAQGNEHYVQPASVRHAVQENFDQIQPLLQHIPAAVQADIKALENWTQKQFQLLAPFLAQRLHAGFIRECHGDMHLGNITRVKDKITIFDGIEFNNEFRWIDVISDLAFLLMDLQYHGKSDYAFRLLNHYLEATGDYQGLQVLAYYQVYRAMVRAKVSALRLSQMPGDSDEYEQQKSSITEHVKLAQQLTVGKCHFLMITHGVSGSGKSYASQQVIEQFNAIRIRSDVERIRMFTDTRTRYTKAATEKTYDRLLEMAGNVTANHYSVVLDATYLEADKREAVQQRAKQLACPFIILDMQCDIKELERRIDQRLQNNTDASEANKEILHRQLASEQALSDQERSFTVSIKPGSKVTEEINNYLLKHS